jgi:hypothetical protein
MNNYERVLRHLQYIYPDEASNSDLVRATGVQPHQQVFLITRRLVETGQVTRRKRGKEWFFTAKSGVSDHIALPLTATEHALGGSTHLAFENYARQVFSNFFSKKLEKGSLAGVPKQWDMLSADAEIVGDAKYYTLVRETDLPPAKFATIAEHVWLLEKTPARIKFLAFGNQIEVPTLWLKKYGSLVGDVRFYFLDKSGAIRTLNKN